MIDINTIQIYKKLNIEESLDLLKNAKQIDSYCNKCRNNSTFKTDKDTELLKINIELRLFDQTPGNAHDTSREWFIKNVNKVIYFKFDCARDESHNIIYVFLVQADGIIKIGQYPSDRDLLDNNISKTIRKLIKDKETYKLCSDYLNKSMILNSEGFGIASVLYLRRVFEYVVNSTLDYDTTLYIPMDEKIKNSEYLPKQFKENKKVYSILSDGVHNLSDEECSNIFKVIYSGMIILLEEYFYQIERRERLNTFSKDIMKL
jgi:hypothetical protein